MNRLMKKKQIMTLITVGLLVLTFVHISGDCGNTATAKASLKTTVSSIVRKQVKSGSSKQSAWKQLFQYTEKTYGYQRVMGFKNTSGWQKKYAQEFYKEKKGSCYHFAAGYAYLARKATGYPVRICMGQTNGFNKSRWQNHAWVEVKIGSKWYVCDPNLDKFGANSSGKYYLKPSSTMKNTYKVSGRVNVTL